MDKHTVMALLGSVFGFGILGIMVAFVFELLDGRIRTLAAVENLYGRPVLGTVKPE
jgi:capsular polysaccharide biosynthesis protein